MTQFVIRYENIYGERETRHVEADSSRMAIKGLYDVKEIIWVKYADEIKPRKKQEKRKAKRSVYDRRAAIDFIRRIREGKV